MASHLVRTPATHLDWIELTRFLIQANIFGTEQDRVNCSFYYKVSTALVLSGFRKSTFTIAISRLEPVGMAIDVHEST